jgi:hypothetical protein
LKSNLVFSFLLAKYKISSTTIALARQTSLNRFKITGLYKPPAIFEESENHRLLKNIDLPLPNATSAKEIPAKPEPTIK